MRKPIRVDGDIAVGPQPTEKSMDRIRDDGYRSIINLRSFGEHDQPLSPQREGRRAEALGIEYCNIQVSRKHLAPADVDRFRQEIERLPAPVYVHSGKDSRAAAFVMMHIAAQRDLTGNEALSAADHRGLAVDSSKTRHFVKHYINELVHV